MEKVDLQLQRDVIAELTWEPQVDPANIGVAVNDGVVTLSGYVTSYPEKLAAEKAARRVAGVKAIAEEIKVRFASDRKTADHEIAKRIVDVFSWHETIPATKIDVLVENGWVTLTGKVDWAYQSDAACKAASHISGVVGVSNRIEILSLPVAADLRDRILAAFKRQAAIDASSVSVVAKGSTVELSGSVKNWNERTIAARVVAAAPGVTKVKNHIEIVP